MTVVLKFGGSSIKNATLISKVSSIIKNKFNNDKKIIVVFSAFGKTTEKLLKCVSLASTGNNEYLDYYNQIHDDNINILKNLFENNQSLLNKLLTETKQLLNNLKDVLKGIYLIRENYDKTLDFILSFGEKLSSKIIFHFLNFNIAKNIKYLDSSKVIKTNNNYFDADVNINTSINHIKKYISENNFELLVVPGFIASSENDNSITTIGRGGSDYTASIFGVGSDSKYVEIWTDVNGIMTCDPNIVSNAQEITEMSFHEMFELSYYGGNVLYHKTISPLCENNIPLFIKNTHNPKHPGTKVSTNVNKKNIISAISCIKQVALLQIQGSSLQGNIGISSRLFTCLSNKNINIILISQSSSEISINFCINKSDVTLATQCINKEFYKEITKSAFRLTLLTNVSIIAVISSNEDNRCLISQKLLQIVNKNKIKIYVHNSSGLNSCIVVDNNKLSKNMNLIHNQLFQTNGFKYNIFLLGLGNIGSGLFNIIKKRTTHDINIVSVTNSKKYIIGYNLQQHNLNQLLSNLNTSESNMNIDEYINNVLDNTLPNKILVDCTSNSIIPKYYETLLNNNIGVVTPNKKGVSSDISLFKNLYQFHKKNNFMFETTVGAGLPVINLLENLVRCQHKITKIQGMFSGTLNHVLSTFMKTNDDFSDIVREAQQKGITEPNPYDDLSGMDVARKILIVVRLCGLNINLEDIPVNSLTQFVANSPDDFFDKIINYDDYYNQLKHDAKSQGKTLKYIASFEPELDDISVKLCEIDSGHPFYNINGTNNVIAITTEIYDEPIVLQGYGAGKYQTASGVLNDILKIKLN
jgi:aspartokinase/homoserine dehydrogenase 1